MNTQANTVSLFLTPVLNPLPDWIYYKAYYPISNVSFLLWDVLILIALNKSHIELPFTLLQLRLTTFKVFISMAPFIFTR